VRLCTDQVAIVLAAGRGTRMGTPKALMAVNGEAWWARQSQRLARAGMPSLWVVSPEVRQAITSAGPPGFRVVEGDPASPQFESFLVAVRALEAEEGGPPQGVYVLPVDVPAPPRRVWQELCETGQVTVPTFQDVHGHPLYLPWEWIAEVLKAMPDHERAGHLRLDTLIAPVARYLNVHEPSVAANLNTPEDVARWLATHEPAAT
jgi:CTP:molybdopterin cytidylyltransferase MocA